MDNKDLNNESDTMYFGSEDTSYEYKEKTYSEEDMYENYKPMTNTNSVEYDDGDYASPLYGADREERLSNRKKIIAAYIFVLVIIVLIIVVSIFKLK